MKKITLTSEELQTTIALAIAAANNATPRKGELIFGTSALARRIGCRRETISRLKARGVITAASFVGKRAVFDLNQVLDELKKNGESIPSTQPVAEGGKDA